MALAFFHRFGAILIDTGRNFQWDGIALGIELVGKTALYAITILLAIQRPHADRVHAFTSRANSTGDELFFDLGLFCCHESDSRVYRF